MLLALILTDVAFGVVSRVVPQLNIFAVGFPMKIIVGLLVVAAALPFMSGWFVDQLQRSVESGLSRDRGRVSACRIKPTRPRKRLPNAARTRAKKGRSRKAPT